MLTSEVRVQWDTDGFGTDRRRMVIGQLVVVLGRLSPRDAIHHRALESLRLLHSLRLSRSWLHLLLYTQMVILKLQNFNVCIDRGVGATLGW